MFKLRVPATSANLGPGFDCLGIAIKLYNYYTFKKIRKGLIFDFEDAKTGEKIKLKKEENLTYMSIINTFDLNFGIKVKGKISVPISRGLGSSATAIIAGIAGTNLLMGQPLSNVDVLNKAIEIEGHPDNIVPAFQGGFNINIMTDDGLINKKIKVKKVKSNIKIIIVIPDFHISTYKLRKVLPSKVDYNDAIYNHSRTALLTSCFQDGNYKNLHIAMKDKLHQDCRAKFIPGFNKIIRTAYLNGALGVALSGSGPTILAFADKNYKKIGMKMVSIFKNQGINSEYTITEPDNKGIQIY